MSDSIRDTSPAGLAAENSALKQRLADLESQLASADRFLANERLVRENERLKSELEAQQDAIRSLLVCLNTFLAKVGAAGLLSGEIMKCV